MPIDYEMLRVIWWLLLLVLIIGFAVMDGFDLGASVLVPFIGKTDTERRVIINTIGPVWEGNQVWFILGGGAVFAAWPYVYAVSFSGFYIAMFLLLLTFIMRPVAFKYRSKEASKTWRYTWDSILSISALLACVVFGVAVGNVIQGVPFHFDASLRTFYTGSFWALFNPFALLCGIMSLCMLVGHGASYLVCKTEGALALRAIRVGRYATLLSVILFALGGWWVDQGIMGYNISHITSHIADSNPLMKSVTMAIGGWMHNYATYPLMMIAPALGLGFGLLSCVTRHCARTALLLSAGHIAMVLTTVALSLFPFILPSSSNPNMSLTVWDASSSHYALFLMLIAVVVFLPIVLSYTAWVYKVLAGPVREKDIEDPTQHHY